MGTIMVTMKGDAALRKRLRMLSLRHEKPIGVLVREAVEKCYGAELNAPNFFDSIRPPKHENGAGKDTPNKELA